MNKIPNFVAIPLLWIAAVIVICCSFAGQFMDRNHIRFLNLFGRKQAIPPYRDTEDED